MKLFIFAILVALLLFGVESQYGRRFCFGVFCPPNTISCEQSIRSTNDGLRIIFRVSCLDNNNTVVDTFNRTRFNIFGPGWNFNSLSVEPAVGFGAPNNWQ